MPRIELKCEICGKSFQRYESEARRNAHNFCSRACCYRARCEGLITQSVMSMRDCIECGIPFMPTKHSRKYCSTDCFYKAHSREMRGSNNPSYIDGRDDDRMEARGKEWETIRKMALERDDYTCQECGISLTEDNTCVHHIAPYPKTRDNSLNNLLCLCRACHMNHHRNEIQGAWYKSISEGVIG